MKAISVVAVVMLAGCAVNVQRGGSPARAERTADEAAVVAVVDGLFDAMRTRDTAAIRRLSHPELRLFVPVTAQNGQKTVDVSTIAQFMSSVAGGRQTLDERAFEPEVRIDGDLAAVWTYYEFRFGTTFSHCGIDAFQLARTSDGWKITALSYTMRQTGCRDR